MYRLLFSNGSFKEQVKKKKCSSLVLQNPASEDALHYIGALRPRGLLARHAHGIGAFVLLLVAAHVNLGSC